MFATHLHLLINHMPVLSLFFGLALHFLSRFSQNRSLASIGNAFYIWAGFSVILVFLTGHGAEEFIEKSPSFSHSRFEAHEEAANIAFAITLIAGVSALIQWGLAFMNKKPKFLSLFIFAMALAAFALNARAGYLGGQIRHTELFPENNSTSLNTGSTP